MDVKNPVHAPRGELALFSGRSGKGLAEKVAHELTLIYKAHELEPTKEGKRTNDGAFELWDGSLESFANGELRYEVKDNIRGKDVFVIQCCDDPTEKSRSINDNITEVELALYTLRHNGRPGNLTAILPLFPYSRADRPDPEKRNTTSLKWFAQKLSYVGKNNIIMTDLHSPIGLNAFPDDHYHDNLSVFPIIVDYARNNYDNLKNLAIISPDVGGAVRARRVSKYLGSRAAIGDKQKASPGEIDDVFLMGRVRGLNALVVDDMYDSLGTSDSVARKLKEKGAASVRLYATHGIFTGKAMERMEKLYSDGIIDKIVVSDTVPNNLNYPFLEKISIAPMLAQAIFRINRNMSVSDMLKDPDVTLYRPLSFYNQP